MNNMHEDLVDHVVSMVNCRRTREAIGYDDERCTRRKISPCPCPFRRKKSPCFCRVHIDPAFFQYLQLLVELRLVGHPVYVYDADAKVEVSVDVYKSRCRLIVETNIETEVHHGEAYKVVQEESIKKVLNAEMFNHGGYVAEEVRPNIPATTVYWDVRVMTYNVCWQALEAKGNFSMCKLVDQPSLPFNRCVANIAEIIATFLPDIILLQEIRHNSTEQWTNGLHAALLHFVPAFDTLYNFAYTTFPRAGVMTLYNRRKFRVISQAQGDFLNAQNSTKTGRPYLITAFDNGLVVANVHFPHMYEISNPAEHGLASFVNDLRNALVHLPNVDVCNPDVQIIVGGDFNIHNVFTVAEVQTELASLISMLPCKTLFPPPHAFDTFRGYSFDHIFNTILPVPTELYTMLPTEEMRDRMGSFMSDHMPVFATIPWLTQGASPDWTDAQEAAELARHPLPPPLTLDQIPEDALYLVHYFTEPPDAPVTTWHNLRRSTDGVFLSLVTRSNRTGLKGYDLTERPATGRFILPLNLLTLSNYYISLEDLYGTLDQGITFFYWQLPEAVAKIREQVEFFGRTFNEVVFPDSINLGTLETCWKLQRANLSVPQYSYERWPELPEERFVITDPAKCPSQLQSSLVVFPGRASASYQTLNLMNEFPNSRTRLWTRTLAAAGGMNRDVNDPAFYDSSTGQYRDVVKNKLKFPNRKKVSLDILHANRTRLRLSELHDLIDYEHSLDQRKLRGYEVYKTNQKALVQNPSLWFTPLTASQTDKLAGLLGGNAKYGTFRLDAVTLLNVALRDMDDSIFPITAATYKSDTRDTMTISVLSRKKPYYPYTGYYPYGEIKKSENEVVELVIVKTPRSGGHYTDESFSADLDATQQLNGKLTEYLAGNLEFHVVATRVGNISALHTNPTFKYGRPRNTDVQDFVAKLSAESTPPYNRIQQSTVFWKPEGVGFLVSFRNSQEPVVRGDDVSNFKSLLS